MQYFDVDTADIVLRLKAASWPFTEKPFLDVTGGNPDLYGPFWLCATLVFVIGVTSNMASWVNIPEDQLEDWHYDFSLMTVAACLVYGFVSCVPLLLWGASKYYGIAFSLSQLICLYGYSVLLFIPSAVRLLYTYCVAACKACVLTLNSA